MTARERLDHRMPEGGCRCGHKLEFCHVENANRWCGGDWTVKESLRDALDTLEKIADGTPGASLQQQANERKSVRLARECIERIEQR